MYVVMRCMHAYVHRIALADQPKSVDRSLFSPDFTNDEVVEVLRDISYYISTRGT